MSLLVIGGMQMPDPASLSISSSDYDSDSSKRNEAGIYQRDRIRGSIVKLNCKWSGISQSDVATILKAVEPASFTVEYYDPKAGGNSVITAYAGEQSCECVNSGSGLVWSLSFDLTAF